MIQSVWRQAWAWGTAVGSRLADQETALTNARRASTQLLRKRVERDEVELYLDDLGNAPAQASAQSPAVPEQRAPRQVAQRRR